MLTQIDSLNGLCLLVILWLATFLEIGGRSMYIAGESDSYKQLIHPHKLPAKTIKTEYGDIYDCIDFYKQPAFDHPLLKKHNFHPQMKPSSKPTQRTASSFTEDTNKSNFGLNDGGCPSGTVPIRRLTDAGRIRAHYASETHRLLGPPPGTHSAIVMGTVTGFSKFLGVEANISTYNPLVGLSQYSLGRITMQNASEGIQVGWIVNRELYMDNETRLFIYTDAKDQHCFNTLCPGFVIVSTEVPLDMVLPASKPGGPIYTCGFQIYQDLTSGNWWLEVNNGGGYNRVGFWPKDLFASLGDSATFASCGGETYSKPGEPYPPMGAGHYPTEDSRSDAFCANIAVVNDDKYVFVDVEMEEYADIDAYRVKDEGIRPHFGHMAFFGGPGSRPS